MNTQKILLISMILSFQWEALAGLSLQEPPIFKGSICNKEKSIQEKSAGFFNSGFFSWARGVSDFSAESDEIKSAPCKSTPESALALNRIKNFLSNIIKNDVQSKTALINGVQFIGESAIMIEAFKSLTTAISALGITNIKEQKDLQNIFNINPSCLKVICAVERIWGSSMGPKILYMYLRYNFNGSEFAYKDSARFKEDELDDVLLALADLPSIYSPLGRTNQRLSHFTRDKTLSVYKSASSRLIYANGLIMLFDGWSDLSRMERQYHVFHELSHNVALRLKYLDVSSDWLEISKWVRAGGEISFGGSACFSSEYAESNPREDFAEATAAYRYNGKWFKKRCPEKYKFIKEKVFKNREYLDFCTCTEAKSEF